MENDISQLKPYISVVCPILDEEGNVAELHGKIVTSLEKIQKPYEIIFVNDGSIDNTAGICQKLAPLTLINFRKNFGQTAAMDCGIKKAQGEIIITLDGDLQNDPADFVKLVAKIDEGYDVVSGWRKNRKDPFLKKFLSRGADYLRKFLINDGIHDSGCTLKAYRRECFERVDLYGEMHRFIPAVLKIEGFTVTEVIVNHHPRKSGKTKYNWKRTIKGFLDMVSVWFWKKYAARPLHLFGGFGIFSLGAGMLLLGYLIVMRLFFDLALSDKIWPMVAIFMILAGFQFFISGLMADILVKNYYQKKRNYVIKEVVENKINRNQTSV